MKTNRSSSSFKTKGGFSSIKKQWRPQQLWPSCHEESGPEELLDYIGFTKSDLQRLQIQSVNMKAVKLMTKRFVDQYNIGL